MRNEKFYRTPLNLGERSPKEILEHWEKFPKAKEFFWDGDQLKDLEYREELKKEWKEVFGADKELYFAKKTGFGGVGKISVISLETGRYNEDEGQVISFEDLDK